MLGFPSAATASYLYADEISNHLDQVDWTTKGSYSYSNDGITTAGNVDVGYLLSRHPIRSRTVPNAVIYPTHWTTVWRLRTLINSRCLLSLTKIYAQISNLFPMHFHVLQSFGMRSHQQSQMNRIDYSDRKRKLINDFFSMPHAPCPMLHDSCAWSCVSRSLGYVGDYGNDDRWQTEQSINTFEILLYPPSLPAKKLQTPTWRCCSCIISWPKLLDISYFEYNHRSTGSCELIGSPPCKGVCSSIDRDVWPRRRHNFFPLKLIETCSPGIKEWRDTV